MMDLCNEKNEWMNKPNQFIKNALSTSLELLPYYSENSAPTCLAHWAKSSK